MTRRSKRTARSSTMQEDVDISYKRSRFNGKESDTASDMISSVSRSSTKLEGQVCYSWDDFHECILKDPSQVTDQLFLQALAIPKPLIPLNVISTMMQAKRNIISAASAVLLASVTWIPLNYVNHVLLLEQKHVRERSDELEKKKMAWFKIFDTLKEVPCIPPRLEVAVMLFRWLHDDSDLWDTVLCNGSLHQESFNYLIQLLEATSIRVHGELPESIQVKVCDVVLNNIVSSWEDTVAEGALQKLASFNLFKAESGLSISTTSRVLRNSFRRSMFRTSMYIMSICPYSVLGFDPHTVDPYNIRCTIGYLECITQNNHGEKTIEVLKCYIELYIKVTLRIDLSSFDFYSACLAIDAQCRFFSCGGLFEYMDDFVLRPDDVLFATMLQIEYKDYVEKFYCDIIRFLMSSDASGNQQIHKTALDPRLEWHLMALLSHAVWQLSSFMSVIQWVVNEYPSILSAQTYWWFPLTRPIKRIKSGTLLHLLCYMQPSQVSLIQSVIQLGIEYGIDRGGMITKNHDDESPLEILAKKIVSQKQILCDFLLDTASPKLITQSEFTDRYLFHSICKGGQVSIAKKIMKTFPNIDILTIVDDCGRLPIHAVFQVHSAVNRKMLQLLLKEGLRRGIDKFQDGMAGLLVKDHHGITPLHFLTKNELFKKKSLVKVIFHNVANAPLLAILLTHSILYLPMPNDSASSLKSWAADRFILQRHLHSIVESFPTSIRARGPDGRLPIHVAIDYDFGQLGIEPSLRQYLAQKIDCDRSFSAEAYALIRNESSCLSCLDPITGLYPFQMIASKDFFRNHRSCDRIKRVNALSEIFTMLRIDPSAIVILGQKLGFIDDKKSRKSSHITLHIGCL